MCRIVQTSEFRFSKFTQIADNFGRGCARLHKASEEQVDVEKVEEELPPWLSSRSGHMLPFHSRSLTREDV